jgi:hypothetical protein
VLFGHTGCNIYSLVTVPGGLCAMPWASFIPEHARSVRLSARAKRDGVVSAVSGGFLRRRRRRVPTETGAGWSAAGCEACRCATDAEAYRRENAIGKVSGILSGLWSEQAVFNGIVGTALRRKVVPARGLLGSTNPMHRFAHGRGWHGHLRPPNEPPAKKHR